MQVTRRVMLNIYDCITTKNLGFLIKKRFIVLLIFIVIWSSHQVTPSCSKVLLTSDQQ